MVKIAVLASFNMDLVMRAERRPSAGETLQGEFATFLGGKGFNHAVAARRLGADVAVVGRLGDDDYGRQFLAALDREGIDRSAVVIDPSTGTGVASIIVEPDGANTILQDPRANRRLTGADIAAAESALAGASAAILQLETSDEAALAFATLMRGHGALVMLNPAPAAALPASLLAAASIVVPNQLEAATMTGRAIRNADEATKAALQMRDQGPTSVVITLGEHGAIGIAGDERITVPAFNIEAIDTVGAGDAFCAGLAVALAEGAPLAPAMRFASAAGALACTKHGAEPSMPYRRDVDALLAADP